MMNIIYMILLYHINKNQKMLKIALINSVKMKLNYYLVKKVYMFMIYKKVNLIMENIMLLNLKSEKMKEKILYLKR